MDSSLYAQLDAWVNQHFDEEVRFLQALVRVPTDTPPGNNAPHAERTAELRRDLRLPWGEEIEAGRGRTGRAAAALHHRASTAASYSAQDRPIAAINIRSTAVAKQCWSRYGAFGSSPGSPRPS